MKKLTGILVIGLFPIFLLAQETPLSSLYNDYTSRSGYMSTEIRPGSMNFEWEKDMDNSTIRNIANKVESIRILRYQPDSDRSGQEKLWRKIQKAASENQYTEVVTVDAEEMQLRMYMMKGSDGITKEAALAVKGKEGVMLATMSGNLDFSEVFTAENLQGLREMGEYFMKQKGSCDHQ